MADTDRSQAALVGRYHHRMDRSWRFVMPVRYRQASRHWVIRSDQAEWLTLVPAEEWDRRLHALAAQTSSGEDRSHARAMAATGIEVKLDRRGRLSVPPLLRHCLKGPDLMVIGTVDKIEVTSAPPGEELNLADARSGC
ncbi:MAG: hypothetical protein ACRDYY_10775 [Acidimicrobiales bacterium]